jgi:DNA-binding transcriptional regulator GbsR (MarR family)
LDTTIVALKATQQQIIDKGIEIDKKVVEIHNMQEYSHVLEKDVVNLKEDVAAQLKISEKLTEALEVMTNDTSQLQVFFMSYECDLFLIFIAL